MMHIVDFQIRFVVDSLMMPIWCLHGDTQLHYLMTSHSYAAVVICIKIIVLGAHVDEDG